VALTTCALSTQWCPGQGLIGADGRGIAEAQALGAEMFVPRAGPKSKPGNGDAACGNDAALHPERAALCALRASPWASAAFNLHGISPNSGPPPSLPSLAPSPGKRRGAKGRGVGRSLSHVWSRQPR
jgi:hypothetical protein